MLSMEQRLNPQTATTAFYHEDALSAIMRRRRSYNNKRHFQNSMSVASLKLLAAQVGYGGNPEHKRNPGDFGLTPPSLPRADKPLCDEVGIFRKCDAEQLLREGVRRGLVSRQCRSGFPQNVWAVTTNGKPLEAQLENADTGVYHGYPMPSSDPFSEEVLIRWEATNG
jgi:hypothetical protein